MMLIKPKVLRGFGGRRGIGFGPLVFGDGRVLVVSGGRFRALDEQSGVVLYEAEAPEDDAIDERPGTLYKRRLAVAHEPGLLLLFDTASGALVKRYQAKSTLWWTAEANGRLLCRTGAGTMLVFDESIWESRSP